MECSLERGITPLDAFFRKREEDEEEKEEERDGGIGLGTEEEEGEAAGELMSNSGRFPFIEKKATFVFSCTSVLIKDKFRFLISITFDVTRRKFSPFAKTMRFSNQTTR